MGEINPITRTQFFVQNQEANHLLANPIFNKDIWQTQEDLGLFVNQHGRRLTLNFQEILPDWLRILFLEFSSIHDPQQINNQAFQDFDDYLHNLNLAKRTISKHYITLNNFFSVCRLEGWLDINTYWFKGRCLPYRAISNDEIDYIPEEVWNQLDQNLPNLPESIQRMVLIILAYFN